MLNSKKLAITGSGVLSPLDPHSDAEVFSGDTAIGLHSIGEEKHWMAPLHSGFEPVIAQLKKENSIYQRLDRTVHLAILATRKAMESAGWSSDQSHTDTGINIGSARGVTGELEIHHQQFLKAAHHLPAYASPATTAGSIGSWVGADLGVEGPVFSHSMTCNSGLFAIGNAMAWLRAGMAQRFLAGGTEAPLTPFTLGQMNALKIYARGHELAHPCRPLHPIKEKLAGLVLGEGAAVFAIEALEQNDQSSALAWIEGFGSCQEKPATATSVSKDGVAFAKAMQQALEQSEDKSPVDAVFLHAPGTQLGDASEMAAVKAVFGNNLPALYSTKWKTGHLFGASGPLSLAHALTTLKHQRIPEFPYAILPKRPAAGPIRKILINSAGFGGNAVSLLISQPEQNN